MNRVASFSVVVGLFLAAEFATGAAPPSPTIASSKDCKLVHNFGKVVIVAFCPATISPSELASMVLSTKGIWLERYGFVQYRIFSTPDALPRNMDEMMKKPDAWFDKYEIGTALFNKATGAKEFWCKKEPKAGLSNCITLLK